MTGLLGIEAFDNVKRVIVVASHPNDMEKVCGGTISILVERGVKIFSVNCTSGDIGTKDPHMNRLTLSSTRISEADAAAHMLGITQTFCLGHRAGELVASLELRAQLARLYRLTQADTLLTYDPFCVGQIHPDRRAAGQAALDAYMPSRMPLYRPEQFFEEGIKVAQLQHIFLFDTTRATNIFIDVTGVYEMKTSACLAHKSQFPNGKADLAAVLATDRAAGQVIGAPYAESFKLLDV